MNIDDLKKILCNEKPAAACCDDYSGKYKIVILQRGHVMVGVYSQIGTQCFLDKASVIRLWGTEKGLGELAKDGPKQNTKLDPTHGQVQFNELTVIATILCKDSAWEKALC